VKNFYDLKNIEALISVYLFLLSIFAFLSLNKIKIG